MKRNSTTLIASFRQQQLNSLDQIKKFQQQQKKSDQSTGLSKEPQDSMAMSIMIKNNKKSGNNVHRSTGLRLATDHNIRLITVDFNWIVKMIEMVKSIQLSARMWIMQLSLIQLKLKFLKVFFLIEKLSYRNLVNDFNSN